MIKNAAFTIEKIPVRLSLISFSSRDCLTYSMRHYFSARGRHDFKHPLMYQIDRNPDCVSLAVYMEGVPVAHCFFHYQHNSDKRKIVVLHNFMVMPRLRGRGIGSLLAIKMLKHMTDPAVEHLEIKIEFSVRDIPRNFASGIFSELLAAKEFTKTGLEIRKLLYEIESEDKSITSAIVNNLITNSGFSRSMARQECVVGIVSDNERFYNKVWEMKWPDFVQLKPIHLNFSSDLGKETKYFDFLIIESTVLRSNAGILHDLPVSRPELPVVIAGDQAAVRSPSILFAETQERVIERLAMYLEPYAPKNRISHPHYIQSNLLHLPESGHISDYRGIHKGERLFIIASGPSLCDVDPAMLEGETTMTLNDALIKFPHTRYASIMDSGKLHELHLKLLEVKILFTLRGNSFGVGINLLGPEGFSPDLEKGIYSGYTVAYFSLQLAIYMGFREICYVGLDMGNTSKKSHFFGTRSLQDRDRPEVYAQMRRSFERVSERVKALGIRVYNCSPVSELTCFPYLPLSSAIGKE